MSMFRNLLIRARETIWRDEKGAVLVEFAIAIPLFLLLFFAILDFGRMAYRYVAAEKAMQVAARIAAVRPPACGGVPNFIGLGSTAVAPPPAVGTSCTSGTNFCAAPATVTCAGNAANPTAAEVWARVQGVLPNDATIANLRFSYAAEPRIGFIGGPYVPIVTTELQNLDFEFVTPLGQLGALVSGGPSNGVGDAAVPFPLISVSVPGEDLALGENG